MAILSSVGTLLAVVQADPATNDAAGFGALTNFENAGCLSTFPPMTGTRDVASYDCLDTGEEIKVLDILRGGQGDIQFAYDEDDVGKSIIEAAAYSNQNSTNILTLRMTIPNGTIYYRKGLVTSFAPNAAVGQVIQATASMDFMGTHVKVPA